MAFAGVPLFYISTISVAAGEAGTKDREAMWCSLP